MTSCRDDYAGSGFLATGFSGRAASRSQYTEAIQELRRKQSPVLQCHVYLDIAVQINESVMHIHTRGVRVGEDIFGHECMTIIYAEFLVSHSRGRCQDIRV
jgi:hypothetical protein